MVVLISLSRSLSNSHLLESSFLMIVFLFYSDPGVSYADAFQVNNFMFLLVFATCILRFRLFISIGFFLTVLEY